MLIINGLPKQLHHFKDRDFRWLWWSHLASNSPFDFHTRSVEQRPDANDFQRSQALGDAITRAKDPKDLVNHILSRHAELLVADKHFDWLKESIRAVLWLYPQVLGCHDHNNPDSTFRPLDVATAPREGLFDNMVLILDLWPTSLPTKQQFLADARGAWGRTKEQSQPVEGWLDKLDKDESNPVAARTKRWEWAWGHTREQVYVKTFRSNLYSRLAKHALPQPIKDDEYRLSVLAAIDAVAFNHPSELELFFRDLKQDWSKKKHADSGRAKKPFSLTRDAHLKLGWLALQMGMKPTNFAEKLIADAYAQQNGPLELSVEMEKKTRQRKKRQLVGEPKHNGI